MPDVTATSTDALVTERLVLRRPRDADLEAFALLCADPEVMRYIGTGRPLDHGTSERSFAIIQSHWARHGSGLRSAISREDGEYLGFVGLAVVPGRSVAGGDTEIGWRLRRAAWGKGYATEGGRRRARPGLRDARHHITGLPHPARQRRVGPGGREARHAPRRSWSGRTRRVRRRSPPHGVTWNDAASSAVELSPA